jgi:hypothetical protein
MPLTPKPLAPRLIVPPGANFSATAAAWYTVNAATFLRFQTATPGVYRYVNMYVGTSSGNIQVGVASLTSLVGAGSLNVSRVAHSGVIACPTGASAARIDLGAFTLPAGDHFLFLWCDNTTATFLHGLSTGFAANRMLFSFTVADGFPAGVTTISTTTRWVSGLTLEGT